MDNTNILNSIINLFNKRNNEFEDRKIVFWIDEEKEFEDFFDETEFENIKKIKILDNNKFQVKYLLNYEDTLSDYLVYTSEDVYKGNWFYDMYLYCDIFRADKISMLLRELKIDNKFRYLIERNKKAFEKASNKMKKYDVNFSKEEIIFESMLSGVLNLKDSNYEDVTKTLLLDNEEKHLKYIKKNINEDDFWKFIEYRFGYKGEKSFEKFSYYLIISDFSYSVNIKYLRKYSNHIASSGIQNIILFFDHWKKLSDSNGYKDFSKKIGDILDIKKEFDKLNYEELSENDTFNFIDEIIINKIIDLINHDVFNYNEFINIIEIRRTKFWYDDFKYIYESLFYFIEIYNLMNSVNLRENENMSSVNDIYNFYTKKLYEFDSFYRKFYENYDRIINFEQLKTIREQIEKLYVNEYLDILNSRWLNAVKNDIDEWKLPHVRSQRNFYANYITKENTRTAVIISDALRYEIAHELYEKLNLETRGSTEIESMFGNIPSYTKLGMASLLPNNQIEIKADGRVFVDGIDSASTENRSLILNKATENNSLVYKTDEFLKLSREEKRNDIKGSKLIYFYHNVVDAIGDNAATEDKIFNASRDAIDEIMNLIKNLRDELSITNIIITADHGFIYQRDELFNTDKLYTSKEEYTEFKRRFILTDKDINPEGTMKFSMNYIGNKNFFVYIPNGNMRFRIQGKGNKYVHGGMTLQEIVIPVIKYKPVRRSSPNSDLYEVKYVELILNDDIKRISNSIFHLNFYQNESANERYMSNSFEVYFTDSEGNIISNVEKIIADKKEDEKRDRTFNTKMILKSMSFNKNKDYFLNIKNLKNDKVERFKYIINIAFTDDFGF